MAYGFGRVLSAAGMFAAAAMCGEVNVERAPTRIGAWIDAGQVWQGKVDFESKVEKQVLTRSKVALTQQATVNGRLLLTGAVGGLFFYSLPIDPAGPHTRLTKFTAVLEEASADYRAGDKDNPWMESKFGLFFEKYNPDAKNLGEYLFRSGTYPGYLQTGGWYILNNAGSFIQGIRTAFPLMDGALRPEAILYMERDWEPTYDLTPAFLVTYEAGKALELGAGVAFNHLIPAKGSSTTPSNRRSAWRKTAQGRDTLLSTNEILDTAALPGLDYYTFQGTKLMARASFNPQALLAPGTMGPEDFKVYAEAAVLGVANHPIYYTKLAKRIPVMVGINLPSFGLVDRMSFEMEYYDSEFPNSLEEVYERTLPIPGGVGGVGTPARQAYVDSLGTQRQLRDKVKWTLWLGKEITPGLGFTFQAASDHFRPMDFNLKPTYEPVTRTWNDWYYMFRLNFGI